MTSPTEKVSRNGIQRLLVWFALGLGLAGEANLPERVEGVARARSVALREDCKASWNSGIVVSGWNGPLLCWLARAPGPIFPLAM